MTEIFLFIFYALEYIVCSIVMVLFFAGDKIADLVKKTVDIFGKVY